MFKIKSTFMAIGTMLATCQSISAQKIENYESKIKPINVSTFHLEKGDISGWMKAKFVDMEGWTITQNIEIHTLENIKFGVKPEINKSYTFIDKNVSELEMNFAFSPDLNLHIQEPGIYPILFVTYYSADSINNTKVKNFKPDRSHWERHAVYFECKNVNGELEYDSYEVKLDDVLDFEKRKEYVHQMHINNSQPRQTTTTTTICSICRGSGVCYKCNGKPEKTIRTGCHSCGGTGHDYSGLICTSCGGGGMSTITQKCEACSGTGLCPHCKKEEIQKIQEEKIKKLKTIFDIFLGKRL